MLYSFTIPAKVFPGLLRLEKDFIDKMADTTSEEFKNTAHEIQENVRN